MTFLRLADRASQYICHTYRCDDTRGCVMQFWPPDDEHICSKHVEAWNKLIVKQKCCASSWLITEIKKVITVCSENDMKRVKTHTVESRHILWQIRSHHTHIIGNTLWYYSRTCPRVIRLTKARWKSCPLHLKVVRCK